MHKTYLKDILRHSLEGISRITSGRAFIAHIDGLRFLAIMSVVYGHICSAFLVSIAVPHGLLGMLDAGPKNIFFANLGSCGKYGVRLFFLLSGFLLSSPFAKARLAPGTQAPDLGAYFLRRIARIEPPFIISLLLIYLLVFFADGNFLPGNLLASAFYSHLLVFQKPSIINDVFWSLEVEVQFYILAPLLATVFAFKGAWVRRGVILAVILLWGYLLPFLQASTPQSLLWYLHYFAGGFLLADLYVCGLAEVCSGRKGYVWDIAGLAAFVLLLLAILSGRSDLYCPAAMFLFALAVFKGPILNKLFSFQPLVVIGGMCYTIYLYHKPMIAAVIAGLQAVGINLVVLPFSLPWFFHAFLILSGVLAACAVLFVCFERPFMRNRWYRDIRTMLPLPKQYLLWVPLSFLSLALIGGFAWPLRVVRQLKILLLPF